MMEPDVPEHDPPTPSILQLEVTNRNDFAIEDFFDGIPVKFPVGETVTVSPEIALHCFGYPGEAKDMAYYMAKRYGWSGRDYLIPAGTHGDALYVQLAAKIDIHPVYYDLVRRNRDDPIPADHGDPDEPLEPMGASETTTKTGKRQRTPARLGSANRAPRPAKGRRETETADVRLRSPRR